MKLEPEPLLVKVIFKTNSQHASLSTAYKRVDVPKNLLGVNAIGPIYRQGNQGSEK